jgi:hypothetical protein
MGVHIDVSPDNGHILGFFDCWGDIRAIDEVPAMLEEYKTEILKIAKKLDDVVRGPRT